MLDEFEGFEPEVAEVIAQRVNEACFNKAMYSKLKKIFMRNCKYLCVFA